MIGMGRADRTTPAAHGRKAAADGNRAAPGADGVAGGDGRCATVIRWGREGPDASGIRAVDGQEVCPATAVSVGKYGLCLGDGAVSIDAHGDPHARANRHLRRTRIDEPEP